MLLLKFFSKRKRYANKKLERIIKLELQKLTRTQKMRKEEQDIGTKNTEKVK